METQTMPKKKCILCNQPVSRSGSEITRKDNTVIFIEFSCLKYAYNRIKADFESIDINNPNWVWENF